MMKCSRTIFILFFFATFSICTYFACGSGNGTDDETAITDDTDETCTDGPDITVDRFTVDYSAGTIGTDLSFTEIVICNIGNEAVESAHQAGIYLMVSTDFSGEYYQPAMTDPLTGIPSGNCLNFSMNVTVSDVPDGYYYVYIYADISNAVDECNENNNWARSAEMIYVEQAATKTHR
jgi:hypothetical protein